MRNPLKQHPKLALFFKAIGIITALCIVIIAGLCLYPNRGRTTPAQTAEQIRSLIGASLDNQLKQAGFDKAPEFISIRIYKYDREIEVWGGQNKDEPLKRIARYPVCAMDFTPGTKLKEGDHRTPEGSFELSFLTNSRNWFMHINLTEDHIDDEGDASSDPSFYLCTDYPTKFDRELSKSAGINKPGSAICVHGNCVSAGCASMENHDFIEIYYWLTLHNTKLYGKPRSHILPFRYYQPCYGWLGKSIAGIDIQTQTPVCSTKAYQSIDNLAIQTTGLNPILNNLGPKKLVKLWQHIAKREKMFYTNPTPQNAELNMSMDIFK